MSRELCGKLYEKIKEEVVGEVVGEVAEKFIGEVEGYQNNHIAFNYCLNFYKTITNITSLLYKIKQNIKTVIQTI